MSQGSEICPHCHRGQVWIQEGRATKRCPKCFGSGIKGAKPPKKCPTCQGNGYNSGACTDCHGSGEI